ncbi:MAG: DUF2799 domain-containing protein [Pseudomonadota bacterium]
MSPQTRLTALVLALGVAACDAPDTVSAEQCQGGDWTSIGFADGKAGRSEGYMSRHREACAKLGIVPDTQAWLAGRERGLKSYCTPQNAYDVGRKGNELNTVCTGPSVTQLNRANARGIKYYAIGREISKLRTRSNDIDTKLLFLGTPQTAEQEREQRELRREQNRVKSEISRLELERIDYSVP